MKVPPSLQRMALRVAKLRGRAKHEHAMVLADAMDQMGWRPNEIPTGPGDEDQPSATSCDR